MKVIPFSNATEFEIWQTNNCDRCCRYSNVSTKRNNAKCKLAFDIDLASVTDGRIRLKTAKEIGIQIHNGYCVTLNNRCSYFNKPIIRKKYSKTKYTNQLEL